MITTCLSDAPHPLLALSLRPGGHQHKHPRLHLHLLGHGRQKTAHPLLLVFTPQPLCQLVPNSPKSATTRAPLSLMLAGCFGLQASHPTSSNNWSNSSSSSWAASAINPKSRNSQKLPHSHEPFCKSTQSSPRLYHQGLQAYSSALPQRNSLSSGGTVGPLSGKRVRVHFPQSGAAQAGQALRLPWHVKMAGLHSRKIISGTRLQLSVIVVITENEKHLNSTRSSTVLF
jgi:hypothetical protein